MSTKSTPTTRGHRAPCVNGDVCGEPAHCPPADTHPAEDAHPAPAAAPVPVPEGGWREGDVAIEVDGMQVAAWRHYASGLWSAIGCGSVETSGIERRMCDGRIVAVHLAPREAPRPEPVVAPLPSEAVTGNIHGLSGWLDSHLDGLGHTSVQSIDWLRSAVDEGLLRLVPEDDEPELITVQVDKHRDGPTFVRIESQEVPIVAGYVHPEPPEDDEDTVRVPREAVEAFLTDYARAPSTDEATEAAHALFLRLGGHC